MKVFIKLKSVITASDDHSDTISHEGNAMLNTQNSLLRLSFPLSGVMQTLVYDKSEPSRLELQRGGDRLIFDTTLAETEGRYKTEYITLFPKIKTHRLVCTLSDAGIGQILLDYTLSLEGELQHFRMTIEVKKAV